jgi:hypothetical protein
VNTHHHTFFVFSTFEFFDQTRTDVQQRIGTLPAAEMAEYLAAASTKADRIAGA